MSAAYQSLLFDDLGSRSVQADFSGGHLSSDGGALLLRQIDAGLGLTRRLARCFADLRNQDWIEHSLESLIAQRIHGLALGYEDLNDHEHLRRDLLLAVCANKLDPLGQARRLQRDKGHPLASAPTLNRLELGTEKRSRAHKILALPERIEQLLLEIGVSCIPKHTPEIILDLDAMGHVLHGNQEGRHFNAFYADYCYMPLYIFAGDIPLWAQLRKSTCGAGVGSVEALQKVLPVLRKRFPQARIIVRGDSGFGLPALMDWCEDNRVHYCLGLHRNTRLQELLDPTMAKARARFYLTGASTRVFTQFQYATLQTWRAERRVIGKAEVMREGENPRFVVTNLTAADFSESEKFRAEPQHIYEEVYCARGNMENVLKQQVLDLEADRMSSHYMGANQLRLWMSTFAYLLLERLRTLTLQGTELARATVGTIRLRILKCAAIINVSVRRVYVQVASSFPLKILYYQCLARLRAQFG